MDNRKWINMTFNKLKVQGGKRGKKEKKPHQVRKPTQGDDHTDKGDQNRGGDGNEVHHSVPIATRILVCLLIEVHSSVPFKSDQFGEGTEVPKRTWRQLPAKGPVPDSEAIDGDDPLLTIPLPQYNSTLAVFLRHAIHFHCCFVDYLWHFSNMATSANGVFDNIPSMIFTRQINAISMLKERCCDS